MKNNHISSGLFRAYLDGECIPEETEKIRRHLEACPTCQEALAQLRNRSLIVQEHLAHLDPSYREAAAPATQSAVRFEEYRSQKEVSKPMFRKLFTSRFRAAWIGLGLVVILGIALAFPPVRAIANSFLGLFRVQRVQVIEVNPGDLPEQLSSSASLEAMFAEDFQAESFGEPQQARDAVEASQIAGIPVRLPTTSDPSPELEVMPGAKMTMKVDLEKARMILQEIGRMDIQLPDELDGAEVSVEIPMIVVASYGDCPATGFQSPIVGGYDPSDPDDQYLLDRCTVFTQLKNPTINAPAGLDVASLGQAYLRLLGMTQDEAAHFSENIDWTTTLVIPIPQYVGATYQDLSVDGVTGTLISLDMDRQPDRYLLMWVKGELIYGLSGPGDVSTAARIAATLK